MTIPPRLAAPRRSSKESGRGSLLRRFSLSGRLALLAAVVTAGVAVLSFVALRRSAGDAVRRSFIDELDASQVAVRRIQEQNRTLLLQTAAMASRSPTLSAAVDAARNSAGSGAVASVENEAASVFGALHEDFWAVTDAAGTLLATNGSVDMPAVGASLASLPVIRHAINDTAVAPGALVGVHRLGATPLQLGAAPIVLHGNRVGVVLIGTPIGGLGGDSIHTVLIVGDSVLASTLDGVKRDSKWQPYWVRISDSEPVITLNGEEYVAARLSLGAGDDGRPAELFLMRSVAAAVDPVLGELRRQAVMIGLIAVLLVGLGSAAASRVLLRPLARFAKFLRTETGAQELAPFDHGGAATEIRSLARAYNGLVHSIQVEHEELHQRMNARATANGSTDAELHHHEPPVVSVGQSLQLRRATPR